jgi:8-oxo-dGTP pyrophosphatase MutT (NUDIX family)
MNDMPPLTNFRIEDITRHGPHEAGVFILADIDGEVVLIRRRPQADYPGLETFWWLPGGGHKSGERLDEAAVREFREETGLEVRLERLVLGLTRNEQFFMFWFRGHVAAGSVSPDGDPTQSTAEVKSFCPANVPFEALWSNIDKIVLAYEGFIDYPVHELLIKHGLWE